ncbi:MAG: hypothetical protein V4671_19345, partial [Armatimonadota bacterium]
ADTYQTIDGGVLSACCDAPVFKDAGLSQPFDAGDLADMVAGSRCDDSRSDDSRFGDGCDFPGGA